MIVEDLVPEAKSLLARIGPTRPFLAYPVEQSVEPADNVEAHNYAFQAGVDDAVRRLTDEYGLAGNSSLAREPGIDLEALLSHPLTGATESDVTMFAVWRTGAQWLVLAARHYSIGGICWSLVLLGAATRGGAPAGEVAIRKLA